MNEKLNKFKQEIKGKKVAVVGVGVSNIPAIKYLVSLGAIVTACDKNENIINDTELNKLNISFNLGEKYLDNLKSFDYIFRSPGVKPFLNEIEEAVNNGVKLTSEIELLINLCNCKVIAVTGSDGKTTTTTLIAKILEEDGYNVHLGGNIGIPLFSKLDSIKSTDIIVLELSSFQLMTLKENIDISVITNISENHLDYHRDYQEYINAKANIFLNNKNGVIVFNHDDIVTKEYLKLVNINNDIRYFSLKDKVDNGTYLNDKYITINFDDEIKLCDINKIKLIGMHNIANICTAISALYGLVKLESILNVITNFSGVEHRIELVRELNGVKWYNDSIASSPSRTIAGLTSFDTKVILIAGGYDKNISYDDIGKYIVDKVKFLILTGNTKEKIKKSVLDIDKNFNIKEFESLDECVVFANSIAKSDDIVILSPASASFDKYKNFEERGQHFKRLVKNL